MEAKPEAVDAGPPAAVAIDIVDVRFSPDTVGGHDVLDIGPEADALARLVTSPSCRPPLTLGIFGDWGAGKTFFMHTMMKRVAEHATPGIVQMEFNAWHYADANIMAGLVHRVFETIGNTDAAATERGKRVLAQLDFGNELAQRAQAEVEERTRAQLQARAEIEQLDAQLRVMQKDIERPVFQLEPVQEALALDGLKSLVTKLTNLENPSTKLLHGRLPSGFLGWLRAAWLDAPMWVAFAGAIGAIAGVGFVALLSELTGPRVTFAVAFGAMLFATTAAIVIGQRAAARLHRFIDRYQVIDRNRDGQRVEVETTAEKLRRSKAVYDEAEARLKEAQSRVQPTTSGVADFIDQRIRTSTGDGAQGLVTRIRADFERLSHVLTESADVPVSRIIVYIDDLDRCPPEKVVEVLAATHLLLGFPLFVVVLAADARWISRSLQKHYPDLLRVVAGTDNAGTALPSSASSIDYLEKIVHLPLWLKPLDQARCRALVDSLLAPDELSEDERGFIARLAPLLGRSPRTVTRFLNIYRLLRPRTMDGCLPQKPAILLLGLVSGEPELASYVLERLRRADAGMTLKQFINSLDAGATGTAKAEWLTQLWRQHGDVMKTLLGDLDASTTLARLQIVGLEAQRYSFLKP